MMEWWVALFLCGLSLLLGALVGFAAGVILGGRVADEVRGPVIATGPDSSLMRSIHERSRRARE